MEVLTASFLKILMNLPHFALLLIMLFIAKLFFDLTTPYKFNKELTEKDNPAFGICLAGYLVGSGIALTGVVFGSEEPLLNEILPLLVGSVVTIILMRLSVIINDLAILHSFSVTKEIVEDRNSGTGFVVAGSSIATGMMLNGVLSGSSESLMLGMRDIAIYWLIGQVILVIGGFVFQMITRYDVHKVIGDEDNLSAGISFGGFPRCNWDYNKICLVWSDQSFWRRDSHHAGVCPVRNGAADTYQNHSG